MKTSKFAFKFKRPLVRKENMQFIPLTVVISLGSGRVVATFIVHGTA